MHMWYVSCIPIMKSSSAKQRQSSRTSSGSPLFPRSSAHASSRSYPSQSSTTYVLITSSCFFIIILTLMATCQVSRVCRDWYRLASDDAIWRPFAYELDPQLEPPEESGIFFFFIASIRCDVVDGGSDNDDDEETEYAWKKKYRELYGMLVELPDQLARAFQDLSETTTTRSHTYWHVYDIDTHVDEEGRGAMIQSTPPPPPVAPPAGQGEEEDTSSESDSDDEARREAHARFQPRTLKQQLRSMSSFFSSSSSSSSS